jgi:hypothetical protein
MTIICFDGVSSNPEISAITARVYKTVRLSIQRAASALHNTSSVTLPQNSLEKDAFDFLHRQKKINRIGASTLEGISRRGTNLDNRRSDISFGNSVQLDFKAPKSVLEQATEANHFKDLKLSGKTLANTSWNSVTKKLVFSPDNDKRVHDILEALAFKHVSDPDPDPAQSKKAQASELRLVLTRLTAISRYGFEITDYGDDHIYWGGDALDSVEQHIKVNQRHLFNFARNGQTYDNPEVFVKFDLSRAGAWPRVFMANVFLAEKDLDGGFVEFLHKLWDAIGAKVIELATSLAMAGIGALVGSVALSEFPVVGTIVGAVIGGVLGYLVGYLIDSFKDDIFLSSENPLGVVLSSPDFLGFSGKRKTRNRTEDFTLGEARYRMTYNWELTT